MDLNTERSIAKANKKLAELESQIQQLEQQRLNVADAIEQEWREILELSDGIAEAKRSMIDEQNLRRRAETLRAVIQRVACALTATGKHGSGWGKKNSELATVTIYPVSGESVEVSTDSKGTLMYSSAHSRM